jgi:hypothetical protein
MDTDKTPKTELPRELLAAAQAPAQFGTDIFIFGGFPKISLEVIENGSRASKGTILELS